jgi:hypothetical protein
MQFLRVYILVLLTGAIIGWAPMALSQQSPPTPNAPAVTTPAPVIPAPIVPPTATTPTIPVVPVTPAPVPAPDAAADPSAPDTSGDGTDELNIGEIPAVQTEELTADMARKALDAYVLVQTKYQDSPLENYDDLQSFVDKDPKGKEFEADIKTFGFPDVNNWNLAVTTLSFAYTNVLDDQTADIKQQIEEITSGTEMAQDMKDRMISSLKAMIPSPNNTKIVTDLIADPIYGEKIKLLETTEE